MVERRVADGGWWFAMLGCGVGLVDDSEGSSGGGEGWGEERGLRCGVRRQVSVCAERARYKRPKGTKIDKVIGKGMN